MLADPSVLRRFYDYIIVMQVLKCDERAFSTKLVKQCNTEGVISDHKKKKKKK